MRPLVLAGLVSMIGHGAFAADAVVLKAGAGSDAAGAICAACHTTEYIVMNSPFLSADAWKAEVTKMRTVFGAPIDDETATEIIAYLGKNYAGPPKP